MKTSIIIKASGEEVPLAPPKNGADYQLDEMRSFIGANRIGVYVDHDNVMVFDEDYLQKKLPFNRRATQIYPELIRRCGPRIVPQVMGDVAIIPRSKLQ